MPSKADYIAAGASDKARSRSILPDRAETTAPKPGSYLAQITQVLNTFGDKLLPIPHKTNIDRQLGEAYLWDEVLRYAKKRSDALWDDLGSESIIKTDDLDPGTHTLIESQKFVASALVTEPVKRFNVKELGKLLKAKYKVPEPVTVELVEQAKKPTKSQTRLSISERSV